MSNFPVWRAAAFLLVFGLLICGTHTYLYRRLVRDAKLSERATRVGRRVFWGLGVGLAVGVASGRLLGEPYGPRVAFAAYVWMGLLIFLLPALWVFDFAKAGWWLSRMRKDEAPPDPARRLALARGAAALSTLGAASAGAVSVHQGLQPPTLREIEVPIDGLPPALRGLRIVQLSDIHIGPTLRRDFCAALVERVNALKPDLVAITGDLVDGSVTGLRDHTAPLGDLRSRHGTFFVTGNHEYYSGADAWIAECRRLGMRVLRNEHVTLDHDGAPFDVVGVDDWTARGFGGDHGYDLAKAVQGRGKRPSLLLSHQPRAIHDAARHGIDLLLCGHTHGGQIWPVGYFVKLVQPYVKGLHNHDGTWIYVHPGTGYWGPPMRLHVPAEIALITLA